MRTTFIVLGIGLMLLARPSDTDAQFVSRTFNDASIRLAPGDRVEVIGHDGRTTRATLERITASSLVVTTSRARISFTELDVEEILRVTHPVGRHAIAIGAGAGFAIGYWKAMCHKPGCADDYGLIGGMFFAPIGAGIGALLHLPTRRTSIFQSIPSRKPALGATPPVPSRP
jgi:hypothetical protein